MYNIVKKVVHNEKVIGYITDSNDPRLKYVMKDEALEHAQ